MSDRGLSIIAKLCRGEHKIQFNRDTDCIFWLSLNLNESSPGESAKYSSTRMWNVFQFAVLSLIGNPKERV